MEEGYSAAYQPVRATDTVTGRDSWDLFSGTLIAIVGVVNVIYGLAATVNSDFFFHQSGQFITGSYRRWGVVILIIGLIQLAAAFAIWSDREWGRLVGVIWASINAVTQLMWLPAVPLQALALFALDLVVVYGLMRPGRSENIG